jgi:hypothetical protein
VVDVEVVELGGRHHFASRLVTELTMRRTIAGLVLTIDTKNR